MASYTWNQIGSDILGDQIYENSGNAVALNADGTILAIGSKNYDISDNNNVGRVRVFKKVNGVWVQMGSDLTPTTFNLGISSNLDFGASVSLSDDGYTLAIGVPSHLRSIVTGENVKNYFTGACIVATFDHANNQWLKDNDGYLQSYTDEDTYFGASVALSGDGKTLVVAAPLEDRGTPTPINAGAVYMYKRNSNYWAIVGDGLLGSFSYGRINKVTINYTGNIFAFTVLSTSGTVGTLPGVVRVMKYDSNGGFSQVGSDLIGPQSGTDSNNEANGDFFGYSIGLNNVGDILAIGAPNVDLTADSTKFDKTGATYVYKFNNGNNSWGQMGDVIYGHKSTTSKYNGRTVSISGDGYTVATGADFYENTMGRTIVCKYDSVNNKWKQLGFEIVGTQGNEESGLEVALSKDGLCVAVTSVLFNSSVTNNTGRTRVYKLQLIALNPISVNFEVAIDASSNITVFGKNMIDISNNIIVAETKLPVSALYSDGKGLIELWEPSDAPNKINVQLANTDNTSRGGANLTNAYKTYAKNLANGLHAVLSGRFDCSMAEPFNASGYSGIQEYTMQRDFGRVALGYIAHHMFGHVDATSAITNDIAFIKSMLSLNTDTAANSDDPQLRINAHKHKSMIDASDVLVWSTSSSSDDANLAVRLTRAIVSKGLTETNQLVVSTVGVNESNFSLANIVAQVVGQDASRLMNEDNSERTKNLHVPLRFIPGDVIYMNIKLLRPGITIGVGNSVTVDDLSGKIAASTNYTLKITLV